MATLSVIELSKLPGLLRAYNDAGEEALAYAGADTDFFAEFGRAAQDAENYGGNNKSDGYSNMVDMGDLVKKAGFLLPKSKKNLLTALDAAVYYQVKGPLRSQASGISCYYSYNGDKEELQAYLSLTTSAAFRHFYDYEVSGELSDEGLKYVRRTCGKYINKPVDPKPVDPPDTLDGFPVDIGNDGLASLNLGKKRAEDLTAVFFNLAYVNEKNGMAIFLGTDGDIISDWENGVFKDDFKDYWGGIDGVLVYMELSEKTDAYCVYSVPVLLNKERYDISVSLINDEYKILGARRAIDKNGKADKNLRALKPGDVIEPIHYVLPDAYSNVYDFSSVAADSITVTEETSFKRMSLGRGRFLYMFEMKDVQNKSYYSEPVIITVR